MTSEGAHKSCRTYGPVSAAKAALGVALPAAGARADPVRHHGERDPRRVAGYACVAGDPRVTRSCSSSPRERNQVAGLHHAPGRGRCHRCARGRTPLDDRQPRSGRRRPSSWARSARRMRHGRGRTCPKDPGSLPRRSELPSLPFMYRPPTAFLRALLAIGRIPVTIEARSTCRTRPGVIPRGATISRSPIPRILSIGRGTVARSRRNPVHGKRGNRGSRVARSCARTGGFAVRRGTPDARLTGWPARSSRRRLARRGARGPSSRSGHLGRAEGRHVAPAPDAVVARSCAPQVGIWGMPEPAVARSAGRLPRASGTRRSTAFDSERGVPARGRETAAGPRKRQCSRPAAEDIRGLTTRSAGTAVGERAISPSSARWTRRPRT